MSWRYRITLPLVFLSMLLLFPGNSVTSTRFFDWQVEQIAMDGRFSIGAWEVSSLSRKLAALVVPPDQGLSPSEQVQLVRSYVRGARLIGELEQQLNHLRSVTQTEAERASVEAIEKELARLRRVQRERRPVAEAIIERQVGTIMAEEGLTALGSLFPPVKFAFSEPPLYLIVSPRDSIALVYGLHLKPDITVSEQEDLEEEVERQFNVSALVEETGGFGAYPAMVLDRASLGWILSTVAHEWVHNYLIFYPLGWNYFTGPQLKTLNETVASIVGDEVGAMTLARYYPDLVPPPPSPCSEKRESFQEEDEGESEFSFGEFMRETRLWVDGLLAEEKVEEAETYMEARRQELVAQGFAIRKLNQAYFAFHGSYATSPGAVDPIGPNLTRLRETSPSLRAFINAVKRFTSVADLEQALSAIDGES